MKITKDDARRILGVREDSSPDEVRSSYKRLALKWHPDKHGDSHVSKDEATQKFQEVSAAYKRLTTNVNDNDDEIDDSEFMNIREMMELFAHIFFHNGVRSCPHHGTDCCDYEDDEYFYSDDEYYDYSEEESEDEFLDTIAHRLRNKFEARKYESVTKDTIQTQRRVTEEEALRNARELIEEEELEKKREEKKKAKRKKKKEKKKLRDKEKKDQEILIENLKKANTIAEEIKEKPNNNKENNNPEKPKLVNGSILKEEKPKEKIVDTNGTSKGKKSKNDNKKSNEKSNKEQKNKNKDDVADKKIKTNSQRNTDSDIDEDAIDTNSAFFARAASKAPSLQQNGAVTHTETVKEPPNDNKKKKNNQTNKQQSTTQSKKNKKQNANNNSTDQNNKKSNTKEDNNKTSPITTTTTTVTTKPPINPNNNTKNTSPPKTEQKTSPLINTTTKSETSNSSDLDSIIFQSRQVAVQGNQMAQSGDYHGAVKMFSKAIQLDPSDFRFFGNRSYCYGRIEKYDSALKDADSAINLAPEWPKGYFRKGRALTGLKRSQEAEQVFQQVLKLDPVCEDAQFELGRVRVQILIDMGFTHQLSEQAVRTYGTVQQALEALLAGKVSDEEDSDNPYLSDEDIPTQNRNIENNIQNKKTQKNIQTKQPEPKCTALWVGNVDPGMVTEKQMTQLFSKCGKVSSVRILPHKYCAFVNYNDSQSAMAAMEKLQGAGLGNQKLLLRFPNNPPPGSFIPESNTATTTTTNTTNKNEATTKNKTPSISEDLKMSGPVNGNECYFWRTTGCVFENQCRYKHVRGHKGIDLSKVQAKYGKIPTN